MEESSGRLALRRGGGCHWGGGPRHRATHWSTDEEAGPRVRPRSESTEHRDVRISDADRDAVARELSEHFGAGRLDASEFEERTKLALGARTSGDLGGVLTDLPRLVSSSEPRRHFRGAALALVVLGIATIGVVVATGLSVGARQGLWFPWWLIPIGIFIALRLRRFGGWHSRQSAAESEGR